MRRVCANPICAGEPLPGKSMCAKHAAEQRKANRTVNNSWYASKPWRVSRRAYLFSHPLCEFVLDNGQTCGRIADGVSASGAQKESGGSVHRPMDPCK